MTRLASFCWCIGTLQVDEEPAAAMVTKGSREEENEEEEEDDDDEEEEEDDDEEEEEEEATSTTASRNNNICNGEEEHPDRNQSKKKGKQVVVATQSSPRFTPHRQASPKSRQISRNNRTIPAMTTKFSILEPHEAQANPNSSVIVRGFIERIEFRNFEDFLTFFQKVKSN